MNVVKNRPKHKTLVGNIGASGTKFIVGNPLPEMGVIGQRMINVRYFEVVL